MEETVVFLDVTPYGIDHEFFIYLFPRTVGEAAEILIFFDIPKMAFCLDGTRLPLYDPFFTLDIGIDFFFQRFPLLIDLHGLVFPSVPFLLVLIQAFVFMGTSAAVGASVHLKGLAISLLLSAFRPDMPQLPPVMADIITPFFVGRRRHVVVFSNVFFVRTGFSFLRILQFDIAGYPFLLQVQEVFLTAVAAIRRHFFKNAAKRLFMLFQHWDHVL